MEHLLNTSQQLMDFHQRLARSLKIIFNWYFFKNFNQQLTFNLEYQEEINTFYSRLQSNFSEVFHPDLITVRCYRQLTAS
jgi:hypothetical protein